MDKMRVTVPVIFIISLLLSISVSANGVNVELRKEVIPSELKKDTVFTVKLTVKNKDNIPYQCRITDSYIIDYFTPLNKVEFEKRPSDDPATSTSWVYLWVLDKEFTLRPREEKVFEYKFRFLGCGGVSKFNIIGFDLYIPSKNFHKRSNNVHVDIPVCNLNGICESEMDENYLRCPQDCPSGSEDNYCDGVKDGICDPDCSRERDQDCFCNRDNICEVEFENYGNCPQDCPSGSEDNYCDGVKDGICDPDCSGEADSDCIVETTLTAPTTTIPGERSRDYLPYIAGAVVILIVAFLIYAKIK